MRRLFVFGTVSLLALLLATSSLAADFNAGVAAYERGNYATALKEFRPLAERGHARAQLFLGLMYNMGQGVPKDYKEAVRWCRKAAEQGNSEAQCSLGLMYTEGQGVPQNYKEAVKWLRKAAGQGYAIAQHNLGYMYAKGQGVPQDYVQAHMWYNLAGAAGEKVGAENREKVAKRMTPAQIAEAQRLAREWKPRPKK